MKIYQDDPNVPYKDTEVNALRSKSQIDAIFAFWGIHDVYWHWNPNGKDVFVQFKINEEVNGVFLNLSAKIEAPMIYKHTAKGKPEEVNWNISLRVMHWFIKSHLEAAYLWQSSKTAAFLPYIASASGEKTLKDVIIPRISDIQQLDAIEEKPEQRPGPRNVTSDTVVETGQR